jgi:small subunit ribosomal protein S20
MPNKQASIKDLRKTKKRTAHNLRIQKNVKSLFKSAKELAKEGKMAEASAKIAAFQKAADKAAKRGVIHANEASRKKSVVMKMIAKK